MFKKRKRLTIYVQVQETKCNFSVKERTIRICKEGRHVHQISFSYTTKIKNKRKSLVSETFSMKHFDRKKHGVQEISLNISRILV